MPFKGFAAVVLLVLVHSAFAQSALAGQDGIDATRLPVSLERIHRELKQATVREERDGLNLRYVIEVYGQAPRLIVFTKEDNLTSGPVPYGAPTHQEMIDHVTPREYRAPAADFSALMRWLAERSKK
jgi:hypothetical protein